MFFNLENNIFFYGALTNSFSQFRLRSWDVKNSPFFDTFSVEEIDIQLSFKYNKIFRVLPISNNWLTDRTRMILPFVCNRLESGEYGRLATPRLLFPSKKNSNFHWSFLIHFLIYLIRTIITQSKLDVLGARKGVSDIARYFFNVHLGKFVDMKDILALKIIGNRCGIKVNVNHYIPNYLACYSSLSKLSKNAVLVGVNKNTLLAKFPYTSKINQIQNPPNVEKNSGLVKFLNYSDIFFNKKNLRYISQLYNLYRDYGAKASNFLIGETLAQKLLIPANKALPNKFTNSHLNCYWLGMGNSTSDFYIDGLSSGFFNGIINYFLNADWGHDTYVNKKTNIDHIADISIIPITYFEKKYVTNHKILQKSFKVIIPVSSVLERGFTTLSIESELKKQLKTQTRFSTHSLHKSLWIVLSTIARIVVWNCLPNPGENLLLGNKGIKSTIHIKTSNYAGQAVFLSKSASLKLSTFKDYGRRFIINSEPKENIPRNIL